MWQRSAQGWDFRTPTMWLSPPGWDKKGSHVRASKATPPRFRTREDKANPGGQVQGLRPSRTRFDRRRRMWGPCRGVTCRHRPCVMDWISTWSKSRTTSPSTGLCGVNESIGGSCFLLIIMLDIHLLFVYYIDLWFIYNFWILLEILLQLLEMPLGYYGIVYCKW